MDSDRSRPNLVPTTMQTFAEDMEPHQNAAPKGGNLYPTLSSSDPYSIEDPVKPPTPEPHVVHEFDPSGYHSVPSDSDSERTKRQQQQNRPPIQRNPVHPDRISPMESPMTYLLAPFNPRAYALLMYFIFWNFPLAIFECFWVNFTFWLSISLVPLCGAGILFLMIFSWTWRAFTALEVAVINVVNPPKRGPIQRDPLSFSPHLTNLLTWISLPYLKFFKICWASLCCGLLAGFWLFSMMFILTPIFYGLGLGWPCPSCTGVWIMFVGVPLGILLFWIACMLAMLLGTAERELIRAIGQSSNRKTEYSGYNEVSGLLGQPENGVYGTGVNKAAGNAYVVPNTSIYEVARKGSNGHRVCLAASCACCWGATIFMLVVIVGGIASAHCSGGWGDMHREESVIGTFSVQADKFSHVGVDTSKWDSDGISGWFYWLNEGKINITQYESYNASNIEITAVHTSIDGDSSAGITAKLENGMVYLSNEDESPAHKLRRCSAYQISIRIPAVPSWTYEQRPELLVQGTTGAKLHMLSDTTAENGYKQITLKTKNADITKSHSTVNPGDLDFSQTTWYIETTDSSINIDKLRTNSPVAVNTSNSDVDIDELQCGGTCSIVTSNSYVRVNRLHMEADWDTYFSIATSNDDVDIELVKYDLDTQNTSTHNIDVKTSNDNIRMESCGYRGSFDLRQSNSGSNNNMLSYNNCLCNIDYLIQSDDQVSGKVVANLGPDDHSRSGVQLQTSNDDVGWRLNRHNRCNNW